MIFVTVMYEKLLMTGQNNGTELCKNVTTLYASYGHIDIAHVYRASCVNISQTRCHCVVPSCLLHPSCPPPALSSLVSRRYPCRSAASVIIVARGPFQPPYFREV